MRALFDVSHPAHVHLFKHAIGALADRGDEVVVTSRDKEITTRLLDDESIPHRVVSRKGDSKAALVAEWALREARMLRIGARFDPDVVVSHLNPPAAHAAAVAGCPSVVFEDSDNVRLPGVFTHPFADVVCTPTSFDRDLGPRQRRYDGYHELAYLHPNWFEPDRGVLERWGVDPDEPYYVLRFVSWGAHHDVGQRGLSPGAKRELVERLDERGEVYVSSEAPLPPEFEEYAVPVPPTAVHDLLYFADLYVGDSQTMSTEAGLLGTPAVRSNSFAGNGDMTNFVELEERYGLVHSIPDEDAALDRALELAADPAAADTWRRRRERMLAEKVDVTALILDVVDEVVGR